MFEVKLDDKTYQADVTFYTALLYEMEFGKDMIQELGRAVPLTKEGDSTASVFFDGINWLALTRVLWAAIKTVDDSVPGYKEWMHEAKNTNLWDFYSDVDKASAECFFRSEPAREKTPRKKQQQKDTA